MLMFSTPLIFVVGLSSAEKAHPVSLQLEDWYKLSFRGISFERSAGAVTEAEVLPLLKAGLCGEVGLRGASVAI